MNWGMGEAERGSGGTHSFRPQQYLTMNTSSWKYQESNRQTRVSNHHQVEHFAGPSPLSNSRELPWYSTKKPEVLKQWVQSRDAGIVRNVHCLPNYCLLSAWECLIPLTTRSLQVTHRELIECVGGPHPLVIKPRTSQTYPAFLFLPLRDWFDLFLR